MEQGNWNVDEMLHWLDMKINREDRNIREQSKKMNENFLHFFEWNAESLYKSHFMSGCYKTANKTEKKREEPPERKIKTGIRR